LNTIVACGATSALFSIHLGTRAAVYEGLKGAAYGGVIEITACGPDRLAEKLCLKFRMNLHACTAYIMHVL
jgi:hypothetical protein